MKATATHAPEGQGSSFNPAWLLLVPMALIVIGFMLAEDEPNTRGFLYACDQVTEYAQQNPGQTTVPQEVVAECAPFVARMAENHRRNEMGKASVRTEWIREHLARHGDKLRKQYAD